MLARTFRQLSSTQRLSTADFFCVPGRYGLALYEAATDKKTVDAVYKSTQNLATIIDQNPSMNKVLNYPFNQHSEIESIFDDISNKVPIDTVTRNFLKVVNDNKRLNVLREMLTKFQLAYRQSNGLAACAITSATSLNQEQKKRIIDALQAIKPDIKKFIPEYSVDSELLGGFTVTIENSQELDFSLRQRINRLSELAK